MKPGSIIKNLREKNELSQSELAEKIGINNSVLSRIESGDRQLRDDELVKIADFFKVSTDYLLGRTNVRNHVDTFAAHTDDEDLSDEAKAELENFKDYLRNKYSK